MDFCPKYSRVAWLITTPKTALFARLRCKQWDCDHCSKKNASIWRAYLTKQLPIVSDNWWLVTLTASSLTRSQLESLANIRDNLEKLFKRMKRVFGHIEYVRVYERHPTSEALHVHMILSGLTPFVVHTLSKRLKRVSTGVLVRKGRKGTWTVRTWLKKVAQECKMGYICDVQHIEDGPLQAMFYITKYLMKALQDIKIAYLRHVQTTKGIGSPTQEKQEGWNVGHYITARDFLPGTVVTDMNTGTIVDNNYWEVYSLYPWND